MEFQSIDSVVVALKCDAFIVDKGVFESGRELEIILVLNFFIKFVFLEIPESNSSITGCGSNICVRSSRKGYC
jgi:hypothetical protein